MLEDYDSSPEEEAIEGNTETAASFLRELKYLLVFVVIWQFDFRISNAAITCLLHLLCWFVSAIGQSFQTHTITEMGNSIPVTLTSLHRLIALEINDFSKVC